MVGQQILKRASLRQMLDHIFFTVIYVIPNLAYHKEMPGYGIDTERCAAIMNQKLQMQKKVYNEK